MPTNPVLRRVVRVGIAVILVVCLMASVWWRLSLPRETSVLSVVFVVRPDRDSLIPFVVYGADVYCLVRGRGRDEQRYLWFMEDSFDDATRELASRLRTPDKEFLSWLAAHSGLSVRAEKVTYPDDGPTSDSHLLRERK